MRRHLLALFVVAVGTAAAPAPCRADTTADTVYWIRLERGDSIEARGAELGWGDFVRYRRADGSVGYVPASRVAAIRGPAGADLRDVVLKKRQRLGTLTGEERGRYKSFSFRGGDRSKCGSFLLTEAGVLFPIDADPGLADEQKMFGLLDYGWMKNVGGRSALGASAFWESGSDHNRGGARIRYRYWLAPRISLELSPGIVVAGNDAFDGPGFIGQAAFNAGDLVSVVVEGEVDRYTYTPYYWTGSYVQAGPTQSFTDTTFRVGVRGGSYVGTLGTIAAALAIAAVASALSGGGLGGW